MSAWQDNKWYFISGGALLVLLLGWAIVQNTLFPYSELGVVIPTEDSLIIIDEEVQRPERFQDGVAYYSLPIGTHSVIHSTETVYPWTADVEVLKDETVIIEPFAVAQAVNGFFVTREDPEFTDILSAFREKAPTENAPRESGSGVKVWVDGNFVLKEVPEKGIAVVYNGTGPVTNVDFYKNREDVFIISSGERVFVIDGNVETFQNFMPLHPGTSGVAADFRKKSDTQVYVKNGSDYLIVGY